MQRKAHVLAAQSSRETEVDESGWSCLLAAGVGIYISASAPDVLSYILVPQVVCSTVACFRLVVVTLLAHFVLHERLHTREMLGVIGCTTGTLLCLCFGPSGDKSNIDPSAGEVYHPLVMSYLTVGGSLLVGLVLLDHAPGSAAEFAKSFRDVALAVATGLAHALEKVFNTEIGYMRTPESFFDDPTWFGMAAAIAFLGLTDFYLNLRGAKRMPLAVFVPLSFAAATSLQYFQSVAIFGEFSDMQPVDIALSLAGAVLSLLGALCIRPPKLGLLGASPESSLEIGLAVPSDDSSRRREEGHFANSFALPSEVSSLECGASN